MHLIDLPSENCSICFDPLNNASCIVIKQCNHVVHLSCGLHLRTCPLCRRPIFREDETIGSLPANLSSITARLDVTDSNFFEQVVSFNIDLVMSKTNCTEEAAIRSLANNNEDLIAAIMEITF